MPASIRYLLCILLIASCISTAANGSTQVIAVTGDPAPDGDGSFRTPSFPELNNLGQVAFSSSLNDVDNGFSSNGGVYIGNGTNVVEVVRSGRTDPSGNYIARNTANLSAINNLGQIVVGLQASFSDPTDVYLVDGSEHTQIGAGSIRDLILNHAGQSVFSTLNGNNANAIFRVDAAGTTQIVVTGQQSPDTNGAIADLFTFATNDLGQVVFHASLQNTLSGSLDNEGLFISDGVNLIPIARKGQTDPGLPLIPWFFGPHDVNDSGHVVFATSTYSVGLDQSYEALSIWANGSLTNLTSRFDSDPNGNGRFDAFRAPAINNAGQVAFVANLSQTANSGVDDRAIYRGNADSLELIVREGQAVPDFDGTFTFYFSDPMINAAGQVAFMAFTTGTSGTPYNVRGIYLYDDDRGLISVAHEGDSMLGSTITLLEFSNGYFGSFRQQQGLNDSGQVTYRFRLADGRSGIALWSMPEVEPLPGDYNSDGTVDAADYTLWRDNLGAEAGTLPNDTTGEAIGVAQYQQWRQNYGNSNVGSAVVPSVAIPEPASAAMLVAAFVLLCVVGGRASHPC